MTSASTAQRSIRHSSNSNPDARLGWLAFRLCSDGEEHTVRLRADKCSIGRHESCTLRLKADDLRPVHCWIVRGSTGAYIRRWSRDTTLNGGPFDTALLSVGDRLRLGSVELELIEACPARGFSISDEPNCLFDEAAALDPATGEDIPFDVWDANDAWMTNASPIKGRRASLRRADGGPDDASLDDRRSPDLAHRIGDLENLLDQYAEDLERQSHEHRTFERDLHDLRSLLTCREVAVDELQLEAAQQRRRLEDERRDWANERDELLGEIQAARVEVESLRVEADTLRRQLADRTDAANRAKSACDALEVERAVAVRSASFAEQLAARDTELAAREDELAECRDRLAVLESELTEREGRIRELESRLEERERESTERLARISAEKEEAARQSDALRQSLDDLRPRFETTMAELNRHREDQSRERETWAETRDSLECELESLRRELEQADSLRESERIAAEQARFEAAGWTERFAAVETELNSARQELAATSVQDQAETDRLRDTIAELREQVEELQSRCDDAAAASEQLIQAREAAEAARASAEEDRDAAHADRASLEAALEDERRKLQSLQSELEEATARASASSPLPNEFAPGDENSISNAAAADVAHQAAIDELERQIEQARAEAQRWSQMLHAEREDWNAARKEFHDAQEGWDVEADHLREATEQANETHEAERAQWELDLTNARAELDAARTRIDEAERLREEAEAELDNERREREELSLQLADLQSNRLDADNQESTDESTDHEHESDETLRNIAETPDCGTGLDIAGARETSAEIATLTADLENDEDSASANDVLSHLRSLGLLRDLSDHDSAGRGSSPSFDDTAVDRSADDEHTEYPELNSDRDRFGEDRAHGNFDSTSEFEDYAHSTDVDEAPEDGSASEWNDGSFEDESEAQDQSEDDESLLLDSDRLDQGSEEESSSPSHGRGGREADHPDDEDSIEEYMNRLLNRMRGGHSAGETHTETKRSDPVTKSKEAPATVAAPAPQPVAPTGEYTPRSKAPERTVNMRAFREVANESARHAISHSTRNQWKATAWLSLAIGLGAICTAMSIYKLVQPGLLMTAALGLLAMVGVAFAFRATMILKNLSKTPSLRESEDSNMPNEMPGDAESMRAFQSPHPAAAASLAAVEIDGAPIPHGDGQGDAYPYSEDESGNGAEYLYDDSPTNDSYDDGVSQFNPRHNDDHQYNDGHRYNDDAVYGEAANNLSSPGESPFAEDDGFHTAAGRTAEAFGPDDDAYEADDPWSADDELDEESRRYAIERDDV